MKNLEYLKAFLEENKKEIYTEVNLINKAIIKPPSLILEPIRSRKKDKNKILSFRVIFIDIELAYNGILDFGDRVEEILSFLESHEVFERNFEMLNREVYWDLHENDNYSYYKASVEYEIDETLANKKDLENYLYMKQLEMGGTLDGNA